MSELVSMDQVRRVWIGSLEITELLRRQLAKEVSSLAVSQFSQPSSWSGPLGISSFSSLSSPFGERDAEGFRCPLHPFERIEDVVKNVVDLLQACRVTDVRVLPGIHPDRDGTTGLPLFFRADALPAD